MARRPGPLSKIRALARKLAKEEENQQEQHRQARALARKGRGGDSEIAHVTPGEIVIPKQLQTSEVMAALDWAAAGAGLTLDRLRVGTRANSINPETGAPEFASDEVVTPLEEITVTARPISDDNVAGIVYNESRALSGPELSRALTHMALTIMNAHDAFGAKRDALAGAATSKVPPNLPPADQAAYDRARAAVADARKIYHSGADPTNFATNYNLPAGHDQFGKPIPPTRAVDPKDPYCFEATYGPFWDNYNRTPRYINTWHISQGDKRRPR